MYKLTKKFFSSSVLIALFLSSNVIIADDVIPNDISLKKQELIKHLLPASIKDIEILTENIDYKEEPPSDGSFAPTIALEYGSGPVDSIVNRIFFLQRIL